MAQSGVARQDLAYEFNCSNSTYRTRGVAGYDVYGFFMAATDHDSPWEAVARDGDNWTFRGIACDGTIPEDGGVDRDLDDIIAIYRVEAEEEALRHGVYSEFGRAAAASQR